MYDEGELGLSRAILELVEDPSAIWMTADEGHFLFDGPGMEDGLVYVSEGAVQQIAMNAGGRRVVMRDVPSGDFIGEVAAIERRPRQGSIVTTERTRACLIPARALQDRLAADPVFALALLQRVAACTATLTTRLAEQALLTTRERLCAELLRLSRPRWRAAAPDQRVISPPPLQSALADKIASRREVVSREISALAREGLLAKGRTGLVLLDVEELERIASRLVDDPEVGAAA